MLQEREKSLLLAGNQSMILPKGTRIKRYILFPVIFESTFQGTNVFMYINPSA